MHNGLHEMLFITYLLPTISIEECYNVSWKGLGDTPGDGDTEGKQIEKVSKALQLKDKKHVRENAFRVGEMQELIQVTCMSLSVLSAAAFRQVCPYPLHLGQWPWGGLPALLPLYLIRRSTHARSLHAGCCR